MGSRSVGAASLLALLWPAAAVAQYAEVPRPLPVPVISGAGIDTTGAFLSATQIGRRLFVAGNFNRLAAPTGSAVVVGPTGAVVPGGFPRFGGDIAQIVADNAGGWLVVGDFTSVDGRALAGFVRVAPNRTLDDRYRAYTDGRIQKVALAHGRIYLMGTFTTINGATRRGLAALDAVTGALSSWGAGFDPRDALRELSVSSVGVYVAGGPIPGHVWGLDAGSGRVLFDREGLVTAIAATSARVYLGGTGFQRPVWAVDPFTGADTDWRCGVAFEYIPVTYGWDATQVAALLADGNRLYITGRLRSEGRETLFAVDAASGQPSNWRPAVTTGPDPSARLFRVGSVLVLSVGTPGSFYAANLSVFDVATAATVPFSPAVSGVVVAVAPAPEGAVLGGGLSAGGGADRSGLAAISLDTFTVDPWVGPPGVGQLSRLVTSLATDGTTLIATTEGDLGGTAARLLKIDPVTGALLAEREFDSVVTAIRIAGTEIVVSTLPRNTNAGVLGVVTIADWSYRALPVSMNGWVTSLDVDGDSIYLAGRFTTLSGVTRANFGAVDRVTGAVLPWHPAADQGGGVVRTAGGRVWVAGEFRNLGGQRRHGLAEVDPATGVPLAWNPDYAGVLAGGTIYPRQAWLHLGADGTLYLTTGVYSSFDERVVAAGQPSSHFTLAYDTTTGRRLPWRPLESGAVLMPDCFLTRSGCLPRAVPAPTNLVVTQAGASVTLSWALAASPERTGVRLEVGRAEGASDLLSLDLAANQQSFSAAAPPGRYFARVRSLAGLATSMTTPDVSFAVGPPDVPAAALDFTARTDGTRVTFAWQPPSTGAPANYLLEGGTGRAKSDLGSLVLAGASNTFQIDLPVGVFWARLIALNAAGRSAPSNDIVVDLTPRYSCGTFPPRNLAASVSGRIVTFTWQSPIDGSDWPPTLVAGSAPGASDLAAVVMPPYVTTFSIVAPAGTYFVRLRLGCFTAAESNEVQVVVP